MGDKQKAIEQIEQSVAIVHGLFLDLAFLVEHQGGTLDQMDHHLRQAADYVEQGNEELYESYQYGKKIRNKRRYVSSTTVIGGLLSRRNTWTVDNLLSLHQNDSARCCGCAS